MSHHISNNFTSTSSNNQADLTTAKADIVAIKAKTDFLSITQNVDLDVIETDTLNNKLDVATLNSQLANSVASTLKTNIDANTAALANKLNNNADDSFNGDLTIYKASDDNNLNVLCDATNRARINICGYGNIQGSGILYVGQGQNTYGGYMCYLGDGTPSADIGSSAGDLGFSDYITFGAFNNGLSRPVFYYNNAISGSNWAAIYYLGDQYIFNSSDLYFSGGDVICRNSSSTEKGRVHCNNTIRGNAGGDVGWTPTGTGSASKMMLENTSTEGAGICVSADATCIWNADNGVYFVDEDSITSTSYAGFYANLTTSGTISTSDERLKVNINDLSFNRNILDIVNDIPVKTYYDKCMYDISGNEERYEKNKHKYTTLRIGTLAQSMPPEVADLLVKDDGGEFPDKHYSVNYDRLVMFCIEAIKELKREIDILKSQ